MKPNFLFIGPDKSGSTWLYRILLQHPDCYVPSCKDIYFFDRYYHRGMDWYLSFFADAPAGTKAVGELSHDYLFSAAAAERIARDLPGVKLMVSLRQPLDRTFSHYLYMVRNGRTREPFELALKKYPDLVDKSMYSKHLSEYFRRFDRSQIQVLFFDDLKSNPTGFAAEVFQFLDVPFIEEIDYGTEVLPASRPRSAWLARLAKLSANACRDMGLTHLVGTVKYGALAGWLYKSYERENRPEMRSEEKRFLLDVFRTDTQQLQDLLQRDLSHWQIV